MDISDASALLCKNYEKDKSDEEERLPALMEKSGSDT